MTLHELTYGKPFSIYQVLSLSQMEELSNRRLEGIDVQLMDDFPHLREIEQMTFIGSFSWMTPAMKRRIVQKRSAMLLGKGWQTPAAVARLYLETKYKTSGRVTTTQYQELYRHRSQPMLAKPGVYPDMVCLDIKSAYWSILKVVGWDADYFPGRWIGKRSDVSDFPFPEHKLSRNCLVTAGLPGRVNVWNKGTLTTMSKRNPLMNQGIFSLVLDVLNSVAAEVASSCDVVYINTDGYIVPIEQQDRLSSVIESWGLPWSIKGQGDADIRSIGVYNIGDAKHIHRPSVRSIETNRVDDSIYRWLKPRFSRLSSVSVNES